MVIDVVHFCQLVGLLIYNKYMHIIGPCNVCISVARSGSVLGSKSIGSVIFQKSSEAKRPGSVCYIYIYIYIAFIFKKICRKTNQLQNI
jgi:hypothetical protein